MNDYELNSLDTAYDRWKTQYQKKMNSDSLAHKIRRIRVDINHQLNQLTPTLNATKKATNRAASNHYCWYSVADSINDVLFQAYSNLHQNDVDCFVQLKSLSKEYIVGMDDYNNDYKALKDYIANNGDAFGYAYVMAGSDKIVDLLWKSGSSRHLLTTCLEGFIKIQCRYGAEAVAERTHNYRMQNRFIQLLKGHTLDGVMYLPTYKRNAKYKLDEKSWKATIKKRKDVFESFWD